jgi:hypothetical protein
MAAASLCESKPAPAMFASTERDLDMQRPRRGGAFHVLRMNHSGFFSSSGFVSSGFFFSSAFG